MKKTKVKVALMREQPPVLSSLYFMCVTVPKVEVRELPLPKRGRE